MFCAQGLLTRFDIIYIPIIFCTYKTNLAKERSEKKNAEHTRMYTIFRNFSRQYSRRLLSILAQLNFNEYKRISCGIIKSQAILTFVFINNYLQLNTNYLTTFAKVLRSSQRNDDHVFIRFAWLCFVNERYNIFRLTFFSQRCSSSLRKKNVDHVVMRFAR